jgi:hypothetical protein
MWMYIAIAAQVLTCLIALGFLWKDWKELSERHRILPVLLLGATLVATGLSVAQAVKAVRDADHQQADAARQEAKHEGESQQFQTTLNTLLDRLGVLQKQVNTEPLLRQNQKLQEDLAETKRLIQATKDQIDKPALKATLAATLDDTTTLPKKEITVTQQLDGSIEFTLYVMNTSAVQAKNGTVFVRVCESCSFAKEPAGFTKAQGSHEFDRASPFALISAGTVLAIPLSVMPPRDAHRVAVAALYRCENCEVSPRDDLFVNF